MNEYEGTASRGKARIIVRKFAGYTSDQLVMLQVPKQLTGDKPSPIWGSEYG
jgi:hypothetical protein